MAQIWQKRKIASAYHLLYQPHKMAIHPTPDSKVGGSNPLGHASFSPSISFWGGLPAGQNRSAPGLESGPPFGK